MEVEAPPALLGAATELRWAPRQQIESAASLVGLETRGADRVLLVPEEALVAQRTPRWITGFAVPERDTVVLLPERVLSYPTTR